MANRNLTAATKFAPVIERVHGGHHPELTRVREITQELQGPNTPGRTSELFHELRSLTGNYAIPDDVCEAFEATYHALEGADRELTHAA